MLSLILKQLKKISLDILTLYRYFIHWNLSKILIIIFGAILGVILLIPFLGTFILSANLDSASWVTILQSYAATNSFGNEFRIFFQTNPILAIFELLLLAFIVIFYLIGFAYNLVLLAKINFGYNKREKLKFFKNSYFDIKLIGKFILVVILLSILVLIPALVYILLLIIVYFSAGGINGIEFLSSNFFAISSLILMIISVLITIYLIYRGIFSIIVLADEKNKKLNSIGVIKESFKLTKGLVVFKFLGYFILYLIFVAFFFILGEILYVVLMNNFYSFFPGIQNFSDIYFFLILIGTLDMFLLSFYKNVLMIEKNIVKELVFEGDIQE